VWLSELSREELYRLRKINKRVKILDMSAVVGGIARERHWLNSVHEVTAIDPSDKNGLLATHRTAGPLTS
jgi:hypothetical protein